MKGKSIAVGLSGGVDSAVAALLLKKQGYDLAGVHLYCWPPRSLIEKEKMTRREWMVKNGCRADEDRQDALKTALELDIPFKVLDFSEEYNRRVVDYFYREYQAGRTPNPDVLCNSQIKFGLFLDWAVENGFDFIATGHYAKLVKGSKHQENRARALLSRSARMCMTARGYSDASAPVIAGSEFVKDEEIFARAPRLFVPKDKKKDQTYFLWQLGQKELSRALFPLGDYLKSEVRGIALDAGLSVARKPDSMGICFIGDVDVRQFLKRRLNEKPGEVVDAKGKVIGEHKGVWFYTIGQRGGWGIFPAEQKKIAVKQKHGDTPVLYVIGKDAKENRLVVGIGKEIYRQSFGVRDINLISPPAPPLNPSTSLGTGLRGGRGEILVRIRHLGKLIPGRVRPFREELVVELEEAQRGVAPGQSTVFYSRDGECLGGGVIT